MTNNLVLNVQTFGAVGKGGKNAAAAINRAAASAAASGRDVYFPAGTYNITDTVTTPARFTFFIDSATLGVADTKRGSGEAVMFIPFTAGKKVLIALAHFQMMSNSPIMANGARQNLSYAEPITPV